MRLGILAVLVALSLTASPAHADGTCAVPTPTAAPATWGRSATPDTAHDASPVARARDLISRAKLLDDEAAADEKAATDLVARIPALRASAVAARDRAERAAPGDERERLLAHAEDLEADLAVSEAEVVSKRREAIENRRTARELRVRAIRLVRDPSQDPAQAVADAKAGRCDPPYRYTPDGRKTYLFECLK
jgi:hypothetical protein